MRKLQIMITDDQYLQLKKAQTDGKSIASIIRDLLSKYLNNNK